MNRRVNKEPFVPAPPWIGEEVEQGFMENADWFGPATWNEEKGMERTEDIGDTRRGATVSEEVGKGFPREGVKSHQHRPDDELEMRVEFLVIGTHIAECLFQDLGVEEIDPRLSFVGGALRK